MAEQLVKHRFEGLEWHRSETGIKGDLIEQAAEFLGVLKVRMPPELVPHVAIEPQEMEEVISLENGVMLDDPVVLLRHEGLDDGGRDLGVIAGTQRVADIVQQGTDHVFFVSACLPGAGGGLQAMLQAIDREPP